MMAIFAVFALVHSGLAYLRPYGEVSLGSCSHLDSIHDIPSYSASGQAFMPYLRIESVCC